MNPDLKKTQPYPFERLATLKATVSPPTHLAAIALSIGEPKHAPPPFVLEVLKNSVAGYSAYPTTAGSDELRDTCARWLERRFGLGDHAVRRANVLPVSGTREALFAFAQAAIDRSATSSRGAPLVAMPNPFYQIYEGAALLAGAEPYFIETPASKGFLPDLDAVPADEGALERGAAPDARSPAPTDATLKPTALGGEWAEIVGALTRQGAVTALVRELALQSELIERCSVGGRSVWRLRVERESLRTTALRDKLQAVLPPTAGGPIDLELVPGQAQDSPALREAAARAQAQQQAEQTIGSDPVVRDLMAQFKTARIVPGSIKPVSRNPSP